ncbi:hypothetical protein HHL11_07090 [Ramlibacter sp. G-1-2-2]|uniref:Putative tail fiber protein gp53-like C-terminal domain-containing protein n=1 Tax=Ramlibacter agri TaxID=2728837 RepID=A0A848GZB9_9BURK|nr:hypothetical protein [Ramlibacter agri]NML43507.1 hypothetical protein [Ramlibacter agri]
MFRIDDPTAQASLPTPEAAGTQGYFTEGNPGSGVSATLVRASFLNMLQEEIMSVLSAAGITPSKSTYNQLLTAIRKSAVLFPGTVIADPGYLPLGVGGMILQWGSKNVPTGSGGTLYTFGTTFPNGPIGIVASHYGASSGIINVEAVGVSASTYRLTHNSGSTAAVFMIAIGT